MKANITKELVLTDKERKFLADFFYTVIDEFGEEIEMYELLSDIAQERTEFRDGSLRINLTYEEAE